MIDPREIITETYEDLHMSELVSWDEYERQLEADFAAHEAEYLEEPDRDCDEEDEYDEDEPLNWAD
jgi:hypothetical protein